MDFFREIESTVSIFTSKSKDVTDERKLKLNSLSQLAISMLKSKNEVNLNFICTHNSRRSQLAEVTFRLAADKLGLKGIKTFSGGTEATALNHRVAAALTTAGFSVQIKENGENPKYIITYSNESDEVIMFSKTFDDSANPDKNSIAIMVCTDAEENCPFVPGAEHRFSLSFRDPKHSDDQENESEVYLEKVYEIGSEMMYLAGQISSAIN